MHYVIIGNGVAGVCAAEAIREIDRRGRITMISDEAVLPYSRPMISMVLEGSVPFERLPIRPTNFYEHVDIEPVLGSRVSHLNVDGKNLQLLDGRTLAFDRLLIASGADARPLKVPGFDLPNIFCMRNQKDIKAALGALPGAEKALVLGGGLVGFKAAYALIRRGLDVTMLITSGYPLAMQVDKTAGKMILDELLGHGLKVRVGVSVTGFEGNGRVRRAQISDGGSLVCDLVAIGKGVRPSHAFVPADRVAKDLGLLVDETLQTSAPGIYAAGDVAECVDIARRKRWVNAIWPEAACQGRIAGFNMAGRRVTFTGSLSRNVMRVLGLDVMTLGLVNPEDDGSCEICAYTDHSRRVYRKLVFQHDRLVGAMLINAIEQGGLLHALIQKQCPVRTPRSRLLSPALNAGQLMAG
jgi:NAD(P)H-nitrite reductase large subunit